LALHFDLLEQQVSGSFGFFKRGDGIDFAPYHLSAEGAP
jgi:hypothetical protein